MNLRNPEELTHEETKWLVSYLRDSSNEITEQLEKSRSYSERLLPLEREGYEKERKLMNTIREKLEITERKLRPESDKITFEIQRDTERLMHISCPIRFVLNGKVTTETIQTRAAEILGVDSKNVRLLRLPTSTALVRGFRRDFAVWECEIYDRATVNTKNLAKQLGPDGLSELWTEMFGEDDNPSGT